MTTEQVARAPIAGPKAGPKARPEPAGDGRLDLLVFGPHPDDAELGAGGCIALHARRGRRVGIIDLTRGELASNGSVEERLAEAREAADRLGAAFRLNLGLPDRGLAADAEQLARVVAVLRRFRPAVVLVPWAEDRHPDHGAAARLVEEACFSGGLPRYRPETEPHRPAAVYYYPVNCRNFQPNLIVDITPVQAIKMVAVRAYRSQFGPRGSGIGPRVDTPLTDPSYLRHIEARDSYWGSLIGAAWGEGLVVKGKTAVAADLVTGTFRYL